MSRFLRLDSPTTLAGEVDKLTAFALVVSVFFAVLVSALIIAFMVRYKRRRSGEVGTEVHGTAWLEIAWITIPFAIMMVLFVWGAQTFFRQSRPPAQAVEYYVVAKQWMWKFQHPDGHREINDLHVPLGRPIKFTMTSEDVIHSLYFPAFRVKADVLPGRYTTLWFQATRAGTYHLFCAEYCGTEHSRMIGRIIVMEPADYAAWLAGAGAAQPAAARGEELYTVYACGSCHRPDSRTRAPLLGGLYGKQVQLASGSTVTANEDYLRESILNPLARVVAGYQPVMPTYQGQINEEDLLQLIAYLKTLPPAAPPAGDRRDGKS